MVLVLRGVFDLSGGVFLQSTLKFAEFADMAVHFVVDPRQREGKLYNGYPDCYHGKIKHVFCLFTYYRIYDIGALDLPNDK